MSISVHVEKLENNREIHFVKFLTVNREGKGYAIPRFCTYCGSTDLTEGELMKYRDIQCNSCGMFIHDCCSQNDYASFKSFKNRREES